MDNLERNMSELKELKNNTRTSRSMHKFQQPNWPSRRKDIRDWRSTQWKKKWEGKIREKRVKRNEQTSKKYEIMWKDLIYILSECDRENDSKLENTLQDIIQENIPNLASQANIQVQEIQRTPQNIPQEEQPQGT